MAPKGRGKTTQKSSRIPFRRTNWGVWAVSEIGQFYLGEVQADTRGHAKRVASELEVWRTHPHFRGINKGHWELKVGVPR